MKNQSSILLRLSKIHKGTMKKVDDADLFTVNGEIIPKVRVFGTVVQQFSSSKENDNSEMVHYTSLTIDDGSETIRIQHWHRDSGEYYSTRIHKMLQPIKIGDTLDIVAKVREYNGEKFLSPFAIAIKNNIIWEMKRRMELINIDFEQSEVGIDNNIESTIVESYNDDSYSDDLSDESENQKVLSAFVPDPKQNTPKALSERTGLDLEYVVYILEDLTTTGEIINSKEDEYELL